MAAPAAVEATKETIQEEASEPLKYKTHVLKVSVHCEGCKKKVKKILHNIEGVYTTNIDLKQQKATVTGNVDAEILIKTLIKKTGKLAELWPEKSAKSKNKKEKLPSDPSSATTIEEATTGNEVEKSTVKVEVIVQEIAKNTDAETTVTGATGNSGGGGQVKLVKFEEAKPEAPVAGNQLPQPVVVEIKAPSEIDGSSGKKKKKKGQNGNEKSEEHEVEHIVVHAPAHTGSQFPGQGQVRYVPVTNYSPPRQHVYHQYPPHYYAPPVHVVSYSTAPHPSTSYGASYYAAPPPQSYGYAYAAGSSNETAPPPPPPQAYRYAYSGSSMESYPPSDFDSNSPPQPSDSFEFFSDENPNACEIM